MSRTNNTHVAQILILRRGKSLSGGDASANIVDGGFTIILMQSRSKSVFSQSRNWRDSSRACTMANHSALGSGLAVASNALSLFA